MQPLEPEHRRLISFATARARAFARNQLAEELRAEIAAEREAMQQEIEALHDKMRAQGEDLQRQMAAVHRKLADAQREAQLLREWFAAHNEHRRVKAELAAHLRQQELEEAWAAEYDPLNTTRH